MMAFTRMLVGDPPSEICVANLHASAGPGRRSEAEREVLKAAGQASEWAEATPLLFGGDLNLRPDQTSVYGELERRHALHGATAPDGLDHLLVAGLETAGRPIRWPPDRREVSENDRAIRLSDHAPVEARFKLE